jgi:hypothetical protein
MHRAGVPERCAASEQEIQCRAHRVDVGTPVKGVTKMSAKTDMAHEPFYPSRVLRYMAVHQRIIAEP